MGQESSTIVGNVILDNGIEGSVQQLTQLGPWLDTGADKVAAVDGKHLERIGLPRRKQIVSQHAHLLNRLDVIEARGRLAERIGALKIHELVHQTRRIDTFARKRAHHIEQAGSLGTKRLVVVFDQQAHIAH